MESNNFDVLDFIMAFEDGDIKEPEIVEGFQYLINNGMAWTLQGMYGRMARDLIEQGFCKPENEWTPEEAKEAFKDYIS